MSESDSYALAVDIGGTHMRAARVRADGRVEAKRRMATPESGQPEAVLDAVRRLLTSVQASDGSAAVADPDAVRGNRRGSGVDARGPRGVGVAVPGPLNPDSGLVYEPPNMVGWGTYPLAARLAERVGLPVWIHNDANLAALGEARHGAGLGHDPLLYLTVSTGIGGGIIQEGQIYAGAHGLAAECGHMVVRARGPRCNAGHEGCLEALASGTAIARRGAELLATAPTTTLLHRYVNIAGLPTAEDVARAAADGDAAARDIFEEAGAALGLAIGGLINVLDPARVVLGGGLIASWDLWAPAMRSAAASYVMAAAARSVAIVPAALGDDAGLVGAGIYALERAQPSITERATT